MELIDKMKIALANTFGMYLKAHGLHWNVEGKDFQQMHAFFGTLYLELHAAVDPFAEEIRALDAYVPYRITDMDMNSSVIQTNLFGTDVAKMLDDIQMANQIVMASLNDAFQSAQKVGNQGLMDFLATRLDVHSKHAWMIKSIRKGV